LSVFRAGKGGGSGPPRGFVAEFRDVMARARRRSAESAARRFREIDMARGVLVILMAAYHCLYTANFLGLSPFDPARGPFRLTAIFIAAGFLLVSGVSLRIQAMRLAASGAAKPFAAVLRRSLAIAVPALLVTVATFLAIGRESFVVFGILHCMAVSGIIAYPFLKRPALALVAGALIVIPGFAFLDGWGFDPAWSRAVFWLGFRPSDYYPIDFVPLIPWAGFVLLGVFAASLLYDAKGKRRYPFPEGAGATLSRGLAYLGRHSLFIYVVHIPFLMAILLGIKSFIGLVIRK
jgi:uncharacterized membrane protein